MATRVVRERRRLIVAGGVLACLLPPSSAAAPSPRDSLLRWIVQADSARVHQIRPLRLRDCGGAGSDSTPTVRCHRVLRHGIKPRVDWLNRFRITAMQVAFPDQPDAACRFQPEVAVRLFTAGDTTDVLLDFACDRLRIYPPSAHPVAGTFRAEHRRLAALVMELLPPARQDSRRHSLPAGISEADTAGIWSRSRAAAGRAGIGGAGPGENGLPAHGDFVYYEDEPVLITAVPPVYPESAREAQIQGKVILHLLVGRDGRVKEVIVMRGVLGLNEAAIQAAKQWVFKPALSGGKPVSVWVEIPMKLPP